MSYPLVVQDHFITVNKLKVFATELCRINAEICTGTEAFLSYDFSFLNLSEILSIISV